MKLWKTISHIGVHHANRSFEKRHCILCNQASVLLLLVSLFLFVIALIYFGWMHAVIMVVVTALLFLVSPLLNFWGYITAGRIFLIFNITASVLIVSLLEKQDEMNNTGALGYFLFRFILIGSAIFPFVLFALREKFILSLCIAVTALSLMMYDPIHNWAGVGFYQKGLYLPHYYFTNYIVMVAYTIAVSSTFFLKYGFETSERKNRDLISQLSEHQQENLEASQLNKKLVKHNTELEQFSYTISHNLKDPLANLKGLFKLLDITDINSTNKKIIDRLQQTVLSLGSTIKDLSNIIDVQNTITQVYQKLSLEEEIGYICVLLQKQIEDHSILIKTNVEEINHVYSVRPILVSILYNLISNGIKYRSQEQRSQVEITSQKNEDQIVIHIQDNGIGIDMEENGHKLFGLYKRFNDTEEKGKGLGLFLVKQQIKTLQGDIKVESTLGSGTLFILSFPIHKCPDKQIIFENMAGILCFNAPLNMLEIEWKKEHSTKETMETMIKVIDFTINYSVSSWIMIHIHSFLNQHLYSLNTYKRSKQSELKKAGLKHLFLVDIYKNGSEETDIAEFKQIIKKFFAMEALVSSTVEEVRNFIAIERMTHAKKNHSFQ